MFNTQEKKERSLGTKLFLKAHRCSSPKCATVRNPYGPGAHGKARRRAPSEFGEQLHEKQKIRLSYGLRDAAMKRLYRDAAKNPGVTGAVMINNLERRLDNVVYRLGFAPSRSVARQMVSHGHMKVNGRRVTIPSYLVKPNDAVIVRPESMEMPMIKELSNTLKKYEPPVWLHMDKEKMEGKVVSPPKDTEFPFNMNLVVDYYSKVTK